jgi:glycolate oxidase FAD binding subunit
MRPPSHSNSDRAAMTFASLVEEWGDRVRNATASRTPLCVMGGGTKSFFGQDIVGETFATSGLSGIVDYDPTELVVTARAGTTLAELEQTLADRGQMLGFEPPHFGDGATLGGCLAAGLSGPRRPYAGAARDLVLGIRLLDGKGDDLSFGGRVMKNVAGFDVSRLMVGSLGTLGIILEASLKCLPMPRMEATRTFEKTVDEALRVVNEWSGAPLPLSATCWFDGTLYVRLSGADTAVTAGARRIGGEPMPDAEQFWNDVREHRQRFYADDAVSLSSTPLWRLSVRSTAPHADLGGAQFIEWGGALRWLRSNGASDAATLRAWARQNGGHATLFRGGDKSCGVFQPLPAAMLGLHQRLKAALDPAGIFNQRRMYQEL